MIRATIVLVGLLVLAPPVDAQQIPDNAHPVPWGKGWECDRAYLERGDSCIHIHLATDQEVRQFMIRQSIAAYSGSCPCPYNVDRAGRRCGGRSAYSRLGGASPLCYQRDISDDAVKRERGKYPPPGIPVQTTSRSG